MSAPVTATDIGPSGVKEIHYFVDDITEEQARKCRPEVPCGALVAQSESGWASKGERPRLGSPGRSSRLALDQASAISA